MQGGNATATGHDMAHLALRQLTDLRVIVIAAITDFILSTLPIMFLWNIRIHKKVKLGICGVMALGFA